jgi:hypothetical protein
VSNATRKKANGSLAISSAGFTASSASPPLNLPAASAPSMISPLANFALF